MRGRGAHFICCAVLLVHTHLWGGRLAETSSQLDGRVATWCRHRRECALSLASPATPLFMLKLRGGSGRDKGLDGPSAGLPVPDQGAAKDVADQGTDQKDREGEFQSILAEFEAKVAELERRAGADRPQGKGATVRSEWVETREEYVKTLEAAFADVDDEEKLMQLLSQSDFDKLDPISVAEEMQQLESAGKALGRGSGEGGLMAARASAAAAARRRAEEEEAEDGAEEDVQGETPADAMGMSDAEELNEGQKNVLREHEAELEDLVKAVLADENANMITETLWLQVTS
jgi:hypothetical protein